MFPIHKGMSAELEGERMDCFPIQTPGMSAELEGERMDCFPIQTPKVLYVVLKKSLYYTFLPPAPVNFQNEIK